MLTPLLPGYEVTKEIRSHDVVEPSANWLVGLELNVGDHKGLGAGSLHSRRILIACRLHRCFYLQEQGVIRIYMNRRPRAIKI